VRQAGQLVEHYPERGQVAAAGGDTGGQVALRVHAYPGDVMPGVMGELGEEGPLSAAVALAERMQGVAVGEEPGQRGDERVAGQSPQPVRCGQPARASSAASVMPSRLRSTPLAGSRYGSPAALLTCGSGTAPAPQLIGGQPAGGYLGEQRQVLGTGFQSLGSHRRQRRRDRVLPLRGLLQHFAGWDLLRGRQRADPDGSQQ
jgi:hypothetical protein